MSEARTLHQKLIDIQQRLKVPKGQENEFGGFKYRSIEDIEDKIKPFLAEHKLTLVFEDEVIAVGERVYVKAIAILSDGTDTIIASAYAREAATPRAKMDDAQLTGACSSYARKYAAGGLFLIDNGKDADSFSGSPTREVKPKVPATPQADELTKSKQSLFEQFKAHDLLTHEDITGFIQSVLQKDTIDSVLDSKRVLKALEMKADEELENA